MSISNAQKEILGQLVLEYRGGNHSQEVLTQMVDIMLPELEDYAQYLAFKNKLRVHEASSLVNEAFARGLECVENVQNPNEYTAFVKRIMFNVKTDDCKDYSQIADKSLLEYDDADEGRVGEDFIETLPENSIELMPEDSLDKSEFERLLGQFVEDLPPRQKSVIEKYFFEGMKQKEIAEELGINHSTVSNAMKDAMNNLNKAITDYEKKHDIRLHGIFALPFMSSLIKELDMPYALSDAAREGIRTKILSDLGFADAVAGAAGSVAAGGAGTAAAKSGLGVLLKTTAAKVAAGVIAVSLVGGGIYYSATHPFTFGGGVSEEQQYYETIVEEDVEEIVLGEDIADKLVVNEEGIWVKFTPKESGFYLFRTKLNSKFDANAIDFTTFRGEIDETRMVFTPGTLSSEDIKNKGGYTLQVADDGMLYEGSTYYIRIQYFNDIGITSMRLDTAEREEMPQVPQLENKADAIEIKEGADLAKHLKKGTTWFAFTPEETAAYRFETGDAADWNHKDVTKICTFKRKTTEFDKVGYGIESYVDYGKGVQCLYFLEELGGEMLADTTYYFQFELKKDRVFDSLKLERVHETYVDAEEVSEGENFAAHLKKGETWIAFTPENSGMYRLEAPSSKKLRANDFNLMTYQSSTAPYDAVGYGISATTDPEKSIYCMYFTEEIGNHLEGGATYYLHFNMKEDGLFDSIKINSTEETLEDVESKLE